MSEAKRFLHIATMGILAIAVALPAGSQIKSTGDNRQSTRRSNRQILRAMSDSCSVPGAYESISVRDRQLRAEITSELQAHTLTATQATCLMCMLNEVSQAQRDYQKRASNLLSLAEVNAIRVAHNSISADMKRAKNNPLLALNPSGVGFTLPYLGYPNGLDLPCSAAKRIGSVSPWWTM